MNKLNQKGFTPVAGLLIVLIIGVFGFAGYYVYNEQNKKEANDNTQSNLATEPTQELPVSSNSESSEELSQDAAQPDPYKGWSTYENTKYGYSLKYPSALKPVGAVSGYGGPESKTEATPESSSIEVNDNKDVFFNIRISEKQSLDPSFIKAQFGDSSGNIDTKKINQNGATGYKVIFQKDLGQVSDFYFFQKTGDDTVYHVTVKKNSEISSKIFDSLKF